MGDQDAVKEAIHSLAAILGTSDNKALWDKFRCAFYRLASDLLGDAAIPEDLGALRLIFICLKKFLSEKFTKLSFSNIDALFIKQFKPFIFLNE